MLFFYNISQGDGYVYKYDGNVYTNVEWQAGNDGYTLVNKSKNILQIFIVSPFNTFIPTFNSYSALVDTTVTHNYVSAEVLPFCKETRPDSGPYVKEENGNIIFPIL